MRETSIEKKLVAAVKKAGGVAMKFVSPGNAGVPDRIILMPRGRVIFVELKTETGKPTALQVAMHRRLRDLGMDVRVLYGSNDVGVFIREIQTLGIPEGGYSVDPLAPQVRTFLGNGPR